MAIINILQLVAFAFLMSFGQILFKKTALTLSSQNSPNLGLVEGILHALTIPWLYLALIVYACATVFWLYLLQRIPLSVAYPFTALAMTIVPIIAYFIFGERMPWSYWLGLFFILCGITIIAR